jgi:flagellar motor switch protein FliN/FliY
MQSSAEDIRHFGDVPLKLEARVPCGRIPMSALIALEPGALLKAERAAGDSVDLLVCSELVAQGELIVIENTFALRISEFAERK